MTIKSISILSHKGGVGKTSIGINMAVFLAKQGKNVCLLDNDFHGPSILTYFNPQVNWINDYLFGKDELDNCIQDVSEHIQTPGKLYTALANPKAEVIQDIIRLDNRRSVRMLQNLIKMKTLLEQDYKIEYLIIDSSPGTGLTTINSMLLTDSSLFVVKLSNADIMGTTEMIAGLIFQWERHIPRCSAGSSFNNEVNKQMGEKLYVRLGCIPSIRRRS